MILFPPCSDHSHCYRDGDRHDWQHWRHSGALLGVLPPQRGGDSLLGGRKVHDEQQGVKKIT